MTAKSWLTWTLVMIVLGAVCSFLLAFIVYLIVLGPIVALTPMTMETARTVAYVFGAVVYVCLVFEPTVDYLKNR